MPRETYRRTHCMNCSGPLPPQEGGRPRKYCSDQCRKQHDAAKSGKRKSVTGGQAGLPPAEVQEVVQRLLDSEQEDIVRQVLTDEIRAQATQYVHDKVLGAAEIVVEMLPIAMAQVYKDLLSESWIERKTAYSMLMKYGFMFRDKEDDSGVDLSQINVNIGIPVPDSPMGDAFADEVHNLELADSDVEFWEATWPVCNVCDKRTHPDNVVWGGPQHTVPQCVSCSARMNYQSRG